MCNFIYIYWLAVHTLTIKQLDLYLNNEIKSFIIILSSATILDTVIICNPDKPRLAGGSNKQVFDGQTPFLSSTSAL